jgi:excinuclease UvrABC helicase subunit UvrB
MNSEALQKAIAVAKQRMEEAAKKLNFQAAAIFRDEMYALQKQIK